MHCFSLMKILGISSLDDVLDQYHVDSHNIVHNMTKVNKHGVVTLEDKTGRLTSSHMTNSFQLNIVLQLTRHSCLQMTCHTGCWMQWRAWQTVSTSSLTTTTNTPPPLNQPTRGRHSNTTAGCLFKGLYSLLSNSKILVCGLIIIVFVVFFHNIKQFFRLVLVTVSQLKIVSCKIATMTEILTCLVWSSHINGWKYNKKTPTK